MFFKWLRQLRLVLISLVWPMSMVSLRIKQWNSKLFPDLTELHSKNSLFQNSDHPAASPVTVLGVILCLNDHQIDFDNAQAMVSEQR